MAVKHVDLDDCYIPLTNNKEITIDVKIGNGQVGSYSIFNGIRFISANKPGKIGTRADVKGKKTTISAIIVDTLKQTNWTSITVFAKENGNEKQFGPYSVEAENHLDTVVYTLKLIHS